MKNKKYFLLLFIGLISLFSIGLGSFISNSVDSANNNNIQTNKEIITLSIRYKIYTDYQPHEELLANLGTKNVTNETEYTALKNLISGYIDISGIEYFNNRNASTILSDSDYSITLGEYVGKILRIKGTLKHEPQKTSSGCGGSTTPESFTGSCSLSIIDNKSTFTTEILANEIYSETIDVLKGYLLKYTDIIDKLSYMSENSDYSFFGLSIIDSSGNVSDTVLSEGYTFNESANLCAHLNKKTSANMPYQNITSKINNNTGTINVYVDSAEANVANDFSYIKETNAFALGDSSTPVIIPKNATVNFCLNNGNAYIKSETNGSFPTTPIEAEMDGKTNQYTIFLNNDLTIKSNGKMLIGGIVGINTQTTGYQGVINQKYVTLDLNGHNIYVEGTLESYGLIKNSKNKGKIYVSGGALYTPAVVCDYKGGTNTKNLTDKKVFPFQQYLLPYLRCKCVIKENSSGSYGSLVGNLHLYVHGEKGPIKAEFITIPIELFGNSTDSFFQVTGKNDTTKDSYLEFDSYIFNGDIEALKDKSVYQYNVLRRNSFSFVNVNFKSNSIKLTVSKDFGTAVSINTGDYVFPISPFFEVFLINSSFSLFQPLQVCPGSIIYADKNSEIIFQSGSSLYINNFMPYHYDKKKENLLTNDYVGDSIQFGSQLYASKYFSKYFSYGVVYNYGKTTFVSGTSPIITGRYNFVDVYYKNGDTYTKITSGNPFEQLKNTYSTTVTTYGYFYLNCDSAYDLMGYAMPLMSFDKAFLNGSNLSYVGSFDVFDPVFITNGKAFFFDVNPSSTFSLKKLKTCTVIEIPLNSYNKQSKSFNYNNQKYIVFSGLCLPFTEGSSSTTGTVPVTFLTSTANKSPITVSFNSTYQMWLR